MRHSTWIAYTRISHLQPLNGQVIDVLATKEEEASLATKRNYELEEVSAEAQAKLKELDRHASWLERRLAEVFLGVMRCWPTNVQVDTRSHGGKI